MPVDDDRSSQGELIEAPVQQEGFAVGDPPEHVERAAGEREHADVQHLDDDQGVHRPRSEEHTSELQSLMRISYAVFCLKKKNKKQNNKLLVAQNKQTKLLSNTHQSTR